jgi:DNA repair exonuclease SbcCD ATPase subunit
LLKIKRLEYKNLLSTGNSPIIIDFDKTTTLVVGENGAGKSTLISALVFALYGKDFRGINKGGLINSINKKKLETTVDLEVSSKKYKIIRGIKPDKFEIYENGSLMEIQAAKKDQQEFFENNILKFPYHAFKQIVTIGSGEYTQFMRLTAAQRRAFIENIIPDVSILNIMSDILKSDISKLKEEEIEIKEKISYLSGVLSSLYKAIEIEDGQNEKELTELKKDLHLKALREKYILNDMLQQNRKIEEINFDSDKHDKLKKALNQITVLIESNNRSINTDKKFISEFSNLQECPTCFQLVGDEHKSHIRLKYQLNIDENTKKIVDLDNKLNKVKENLELHESSLKQIADIQFKINDLINEKKYIIREAEAIKEKIESISNKNTELKQDLTLKENEIKLFNDRQTEIRSKLDLYQTKAILLKDTGIKSKVISNYLEMINKLVNNYLDLFEFNVEFYLDETFNESLKSRYRDEFKYNNFSEGEKSRIDLSLLFTWRELARINNNLNCNLLLLDEVFDSSLDSNGIADLKIIFDKYSDLNIIVISHRDDVGEQFESTLKFKKIKNFTTMEKQ